MLASAAFLALAAAPAAQATTVADAAGDFLPSFVGAHDADLDVLSFTVDFDPVAEAFDLSAQLAGAIDPTHAGFYVIGVNTGTGVIQPFGPIGAPDVIFNTAIVLQKSGAFTVNGHSGAGVISGDTFSLRVNLADLPASTGFAPQHYGFNLWPRLAGGLTSIADFAPDNATLAAAPEPAAWGLMILGFGLLGGAMRRHRRTQPAAA
jgi:hypothetical protein